MGRERREGPLSLKKNCFSPPIKKIQGVGGGNPPRWKGSHSPEDFSEAKKTSFLRKEEEPFEATKCQSKKYGGLEKDRKEVGLNSAYGVC